ncbi:hypothetical protein Tco_1420138 [Tanacetum coccineum]
MLVFISDKQALVVMHSSVAKVFFMGRRGYGIGAQSYKLYLLEYLHGVGHFKCDFLITLLKHDCLFFFIVDEAGFVYEGFSKNHFSKVAIDNAIGIFQYHEVAFIGEASYENFYTLHPSYKVANFIGFISHDLIILMPRHDGLIGDSRSM